MHTESLEEYLSFDIENMLLPFDQSPQTMLDPMFNSIDMMMDFEWPRGENFLEYPVVQDGQLPMQTTTAYDNASTESTSHMQPITSSQPFVTDNLPPIMERQLCNSEHDQYGRDQNMSNNDQNLHGGYECLMLSNIESRIKKLEDQFILFDEQTK
jgi:hypothetical protein